MKKQLLTLLAFTCLILFSATESKAVSVEGWDWKNVTTYDTENATYTVCKSTDGKKCWIQHIDLGITSVLKIPESIQGVPVTRIGAYNTEDTENSSEEVNVFNCAFGDINGKFTSNNEQVKEIVLPDTVEEILLACFAGLSNMKTINTPQNLCRVEAGAFGSCHRLQKFDVGEKVEDMQFTAFYDCSSLNKIKVSKKNKYYKVKGNAIVSVDGKEFYSFSQKVKKGKLPKTVEKIKSHALQAFSPREIVLPKKLKEIEYRGLVTNNALKLSISKKNQMFVVKNNCLYNKKSGNLIAISYKNGIVRIPKGVTRLEKGISMSGSGEIKKMVIPKSVNYLGNRWYDGGNYSLKLKVFFESRIPPKVSKSQNNKAPDCLFYYANHIVPAKSYNIYRKWMKEQGLAEYDYKLNGKAI